MGTKELDFSEDKINQWWREVKDNFWGDLKEEFLRLVKYLLEGTLQEEMMKFTGSSWHERTERRRGYRNGSYRRDLLTEMGLIREIIVPRTRKKGFKSKIFERYQRRQEKVNGAIREMFVAGVSTRRVGDVLQILLEDRVSAGTVSEIAKELDKCVEAFQKRPLKDKYIYLFLDGIFLGVKGFLKAKKRPVLVAYGITEEGEREIIDFRVASSESEAQWEAFLNNLYKRGLSGEKLKLVITDGGKGLLKALDTVYPYTERQRCWAHKMRNVSNYLPKKYREECLKGARSIYQAPHQKEAVARFRAWAREWRGRVPDAVECLEKDLDDLLAFFQFPLAHWKKIRTTNVIERSFREVRRRTRTMSCFNNVGSCERIVYAVIFHLNQKWEKPQAWLKEFKQKLTRAA